MKQAAPSFGDFPEAEELSVIPAKAGIQETPRVSCWAGWIPAFAGMTAKVVFPFRYVTQN
ncbi:hypothetical protein EI613_27985 [Azospirillum sp. 412522]|nr:hypothetical protein [Azospirillum sp. 412522]